MPNPLPDCSIPFQLALLLYELSHYFPHPIPTEPTLIRFTLLREDYSHSDSSYLNPLWCVSYFADLSNTAIPDMFPSHLISS